MGRGVGGMIVCCIMVARRDARLSRLRSMLLDAVTTGCRNVDRSCRGLVESKVRMLTVSATWLSSLETMACMMIISRGGHRMAHTHIA